MTTIVYSYPAFIKKLTDNFGMPFDAVIDHGGFRWMLTKDSYSMWLMPNKTDENGRDCIVCVGFRMIYRTDKPFVKTDMTLIEFISGKTEVQIIET